MNIKRNKDLIEVFNDSWKANHNKNLEDKIRNNRIDTINRSYGVLNKPIRKENKPVGYNNLNGRR